MEPQTVSPIYVTQKKAHTDAIVSIDVLESNNDIITTCSDDKTIRLWDLRINSSIKQFKDPLFAENSASNAKMSPDGSRLYVGAGQNILEFDLKTEKILVDKAVRSQEKTRDEINFVTVSPNGKFLASCDDSGDIQIYDSETLDTSASFKDNHKNIPFTIDFINPGDKPIPYCIDLLLILSNDYCIGVSSGFDCEVIFWDLEKKAPIKHVNITELCAKYIKGQLISPPHVYNLCVRQSTVLVSTETGHIIALTFKEHKKPKYIIDAHLGKIMRSTFCRFNEDIIASASSDSTFALWDIKNRDEYGVPSFLRKVEIPNKPNWMETTKDRKVLIGDTSEYLYIYSIKE